MALLAAAAAAADHGPDWSCLPAAALRHIFCLNSTWQAPGSCLGAPVCRSWRSAAAGCTGIRLLYQLGQSRRASFKAWLTCNSSQLEALILTSHNHDDMTAVLAPLYTAAAAAAAAGRPLRLTTLCVPGVNPVDTRLVGKLLAALPHLRTLQLSGGSWQCNADAEYVQEKLAPLRQHPQLQELYLGGRLSYTAGSGEHSAAAVAGLLPTRLQRLAWQGYWRNEAVPDLSHLNQLTFLQLSGWHGGHCSSSKLPPRLRELQVSWVTGALGTVHEQRQVVTQFNDMGHDTLQEAGNLPQLKELDLHHHLLGSPEACAQLAQLSQVSYLNLTDKALQAVLPMVAAFSSLRWLRLSFDGWPPVRLHGLGALTTVTHLNVMSFGSGSRTHVWAEEVGKMANLKWLSVPADWLLIEVPWLAGLQQLRVLVLRELFYRKDEQGPAKLEQVLQFLEGASSSLQALPRRLMVVGVSGEAVHQAASADMRRRLQRLVGSSGCEVVLGSDLDAIAHPVQQLAGLPEALQQTLA